MIEIEKKMYEVDSLTILRPLCVLVVSGGEGGCEFGSNATLSYGLKHFCEISKWSTQLSVILQD